MEGGKEGEGDEKLRIIVTVEVTCAFKIKIVFHFLCLWILFNHNVQMFLYVKFLLKMME